MSYRKMLVLVLFLIMLITDAGLAVDVSQIPSFEPHFDLIIRPVSLWRPHFAVKGSVAIPGHVEKVEFTRIPGQEFIFRVNGIEQSLDESGMLVRPVSALSTEPWLVAFEGISQLRAPKSLASGDEVYCLNNCPPSPEILTDAPSSYNVKYDLPPGYSAISFDSEIPSSMGLQFQIARFQPPIIRKTRNFSFEYVFPEGFNADSAYLDFLETTMEKWFELFGSPGFTTVRIGVIRRGEAKGEINGSPCGNLILLSRSALGGKVDLSGLTAMGIDNSSATQFRKMVIAHELSHFWFGVKFTGHDGWMTEGIPQYLGICAVRQETPDQVRPLLVFTEHLDKMIPQDAIPDNPFSDDQILYIKAYYQGSLALFRIGEMIGHENLHGLLRAVFDENKNPAFADFDRHFKQLYPEKHQDWLKAWRVK